MDSYTFNHYSIIFLFVNSILTFVGIVGLGLTIIITCRSIRRSIQNSAYNVWRRVYAKITQHPAILGFFDYEDRNNVDLEMLSTFLMILDMYENMFLGNYKKLSSEKIVLHKIMRSDKAKEYWKICREYFFSNKRFINEIDKLAASLSKS